MCIFNVNFNVFVKLVKVFILLEQLIQINISLQRGTKISSFFITEH